MTSTEIIRAIWNALAEDRDNRTKLFAFESFHLSPRNDRYDPCSDAFSLTIEDVEGRWNLVIIRDHETARGTHIRCRAAIIRPLTNGHKIIRELAHTLTPLNRMAHAIYDGRDAADVRHLSGRW